jgi:DNA-binding response OmpR family regulator
LHALNQRWLACVAMGRKIVVVEDEHLIAESVAARLRAEGLEVEIAYDGPTGVEICRRIRPDLVILDLMLPGYDGLEVCRRIQEERPVPVLMLTARDSETDLVVGLGVGADDYITKPFGQRELVARVHALLRRAERGGADATQSEILTVGSLEIDLPARRARRGGEEVELTPKEFDLLVHLAQSPGIVFSRGRLLTEVWQYADSAGERTVDSHVAGLRRKLGEGVVRTARGAGYALEDEPG